MIQHIIHLATHLKQLAQHDALPNDLIVKLPLPAWIIYHAYRKPSDKPIGEKITAAFQHMGPTFIKLGQMLSTRPDIVGKDVADALSQLQDKLKPFDSKEALRIIEASIGQPLKKVFKSITAAPAAAASIAQVHRGVLISGENVAIKVLRPHIRDTFDRDITAFAWAARWLSRLDSHARRTFKPVEVVTLFETWVNTELDLKMEAAHADRLRQNFSKGADFEVPKVYWSLCRHDVMVSTWINGCRIDDLKTIKSWGLNPTDILKKSATAFFYQIFEHGFFHADLHPGNMFVTKQGRLSPVDFGIMGTLDLETRTYLGRILHAFLKRDYMSVARIHVEAGLVPPDTNIESFANAARAIGEPLLDKPKNKIHVGPLIEGLFVIARQYGMVVQPHLLLLQKTIVMAEGLGRTLDSRVNMWVMLEPLMSKWMRRTLGPEQALRKKIEKISEIIDKLPAALDLYLNTPTPKPSGKKWRGVLGWAVAFGLGLLIGYGAYVAR